jgi:carbon monoxide dehydrogenase subunit G
LEIEGQAGHTSAAAFDIDDCRYSFDRSEAHPLRQAARDIVGDSRIAVVAKRLDLTQCRQNGGRGAQHGAANHESRKQRPAHRSHVSIDRQRAASVTLPHSRSLAGGYIAPEVHFEKSIEIDASQQRVWEVLSDLEAWPRRIETVDTVELLTPAPLTKGSRVRLKQPKLSEGTWDITVWDAPASFEWTQREGGITIVAAHRVEAVGDGRARLTLTIDMRGLLVPVFGRFYKGLTNDYMNLEAEGMKRAAETA